MKHLGLIAAIFLASISVCSSSANAATASFVKMDTVTQGNWVGVYGGNGYAIPNDTTIKLPPYSSGITTTAKSYTWIATTTDIRALQRPESPTTRMATQWFSYNAFTIPLGITDTATHRVAIYALDWDCTCRTETINILDAVSNAVLATVPVPSSAAFHNGEYAVFQFAGNVTIQVIFSNTPPQPVLPPTQNMTVSGVFLDTVAPPPPAPVNTVPGAISSPPVVGVPTIGTTGAWSNSPTSYVCQWLGNGVVITGATNCASYTPAASDAGNALTESVQGCNAGGCGAAVISSPSPLVVARANTTMPPAGYVLTFDDEFTTMADICPDANYTSTCKWWNGTEQCCFTPSDTTVGGPFPTPVISLGKAVNPYSVTSAGLQITLQKYPAPPPAGATGYWNGGIMTSLSGGTPRQGFQQQYGYFEIEAQLPIGPGTWPAFWMLPQNGKGEFDIFEQYGLAAGSDNGGCITFHDYSGAGGGFQQCTNTLYQGETTGFHKWGFLWTPTTMTFFYDGVQIFANPSNSPAFQQPFYMLVDLGIGGGWPTQNTPSPSVMQVRSVKAWAPPS